MSEAIPTNVVQSSSAEEPVARPALRAIGLLVVPPATLVLLAMTLRAGRAADLVIAGLAMLALALAAAVFASEE